MAVRYPGVGRWLENNGWKINEITNKWFLPKDAIEKSESAKEYQKKMNAKKDTRRIRECPDCGEKYVAIKYVGIYVPRIIEYDKCKNCR